VPIFYIMEWVPYREGPRCRPIGVWAMAAGADLQLIPGYAERAGIAEDIRERLIASGPLPSAEEVLNEQTLELPMGLGHCGPITRTDSFVSTLECVQGLLAFIEEQWHIKKMRWRSGLLMPLERYKLSADR